MYVYRRLARVRRFTFWSAATLYVLTFPFIILDVTGIVLRPAQSTPFVQTGALEVVTRPDGCEVVVRGRSERLLTPAVVEGLQPGKHEVEIRGPGGTTWRGSVDIAAGEVTTVKGLPAGAPALVRIPLPAGPVVAACRSLVSSSVLLASADEPVLAMLDVAAGRLVPVRPASAPAAAIRGRVSSITPLLADAEFLIQTEARAVLLDQSALGGWSSTELPFGLPAGVLPLAASWRERAVMYLDGLRVVQRSASGDRSLAAINAPVVASGVAGGVRMLLDGEGTLYHQVRFLAPRPVASYSLGPLAALAGGPPGRIVAQKGAVLVVHAGPSLYLLTRSRAIEVPGVTGAVFDETRERVVVWSANRIGRLDYPWIDAEEPRASRPGKAPTLSWIVQTESAVQKAVPTRDGDAVLALTDNALIVCVLTEHVALEPVTIAPLSREEVRPVIDPSGVIVRANEPLQALLLRLVPPPAVPGEAR